MICTVFTTAPRPMPTLAHSVASFRNAGFDAPLVLCDWLDEGALDLASVDAARIEINSPPLGCLKNWARALLELCRAQAPWCLIAQDDTIWASGSYAVLKKELLSIQQTKRFAQLGMISLFCPQRVSNYLLKRHAHLSHGYYDVDMGWDTWGAQAFLFPLHSARLLHQDPQFMKFVDTYTKNRNVDRIVPKCLLDMKLKVRYRIPSLVEHSLGSGNSSLGEKPVQRGLETRYFNGVAR